MAMHTTATATVTTAFSLSQNPIKTSLQSFLFHFPFLNPLYYLFPLLIFYFFQFPTSFNNFFVSSSKRYNRLSCSTISSPTTTTNYEFSDGSSEVELRLPLGNQDFLSSRHVFVDADGASAIVRLQSSGSLITLIETNNLFDRIKSAETIWYIDDDELVINLKKQDPDLKWPDIVESWESLTAGAMQLLKGTSIYIVGHSTEINQKVARELAVGLGYTPLDTQELLETFAKQTIDSFMFALLFQHWEGSWELLEGLINDDIFIAGFTVWLSQTEAIDENSAKVGEKRNIKDGSLVYTNADVVVKIQGWDANHAKSVAQASLSVLKQLILSDKKLPGKKSLYISLGCRDDWPNIKPPGWDPSAEGDATS